MSAAAASNLDKDILNTLTPEELEAVQGTGVSDDERQTLERLANAGDASGAADGDDDADDDGGDPNEVLDADGNPVKAAPAEGDPTKDSAGTQAKDDKPAEPAAAAKPADQDPATPPTPKLTQAQTQVVYKAELPPDHADQVKALAEESKALRDKFKAGDIDLDEFDAQNAELQEKREQLQRAVTKAELMADLNQQNSETAWRNTVVSFVESTKAAGGPDYGTDEAMRNDLDMFVKALANNEANNDKPMDWFLQEAHKRTMALHGMAPATPAPAAAGKDGKKADVAASRKPPIDALPASLAHVPGGDSPGDVGGDEFAHLDSLTGQDLEDAIARMSPAQREKYALVG